MAGASGTSVSGTVSPGSSERSQPEVSLRVAQVASYFPTHTGGLEVAAWNIARATAGRKVDVDFFACGSTEGCPGQSGLQVHAVPFADLLDRRFGLPMPLWGVAGIRSLAAAVRRVDVVHVHDTLYFSSVLGAALAWWYRKPLLLTVHVSRLRFRSRALDVLFRIATRLVSRPLLNRVDQVAFVGTTALEFHSGHVRFRRPPAVIPNGVDRAIFRKPIDTDRRLQRRRLGLPADQPVFLFVGRLVEKKGVALIAETARDLPEVTFVFVGDGPIDPGHWKLPNVRAIGRLDPSEIVPYYQAADLVLSPGVGEGGITLVVQEAMSCGTPVLVSEEVGKAFGTGRPAGVLAVDLNGEAAAARLAGCLREAARAVHALHSLSDEVSRYADRWNWDRVADSYVGLYAVLAERNRGVDSGGN